MAEVTAITHRKDAMFHSILAGRNPEHNALGSIATFGIKRALTDALRSQLSGIIDLHVYMESRMGAMMHVVMSIKKRNDAEPMMLIEAAFAAAGGFFPVSQMTKRIIVVDEDVNVHDLNDVEWAMYTCIARAEKYRIMPDVTSWELERCARGGKGSIRLAIDATKDIADRDDMVRPSIPGASAIRLEDYLRKTPQG